MRDKAAIKKAQEKYRAKKRVELAEKAKLIREAKKGPLKEFVFLYQMEQ